MNLENIINMTPKAAEYLNYLVAKKNAHGFYLKIKNSGCSGMRYDPEVVNAAPSGDILSANFSGLQVFIDKSSAEILQDTIIDCKDLVLKQKQITYSNPNAEDVCGCGESFNIKDKQ